MTGSRPNGFAAKLLDRAAGLTGPLRPRITPYYAVPMTAAEPLIEETGMYRPARPPEPQLRFDDDPRQVDGKKTRNHSVPAEPKPEVERQIEEPRLMPPMPQNQDDLAPQPAATWSKPEGESRPGVDRATPEAPPQEGQVSVRTPDVQVAAIPGRGGSETSAPQPLAAMAGPDLKTALAAAVARLTPSRDRDEETALMPRNELERVIPAVPPSGAPEAQAPRHDTGAQPHAPLEIHIGEIVIAADPQDEMSASAAKAPPQTDWKPMLTLDDYREQRRKEGI